MHVLELSEIKKTHYYKRRPCFQIGPITFALEKGKTVALVGESGAGKSSIARIVMLLDKPDSGQILFNGTAVTRAEKTRYRSKVQIIFQDPYTTLNPRMTTKMTLLEPWEIHKSGSLQEAENKMRTLLQMVGLSKHHLDRFPHQLSGGERQRVGIARALMVSPEFLVLDEPTASLDYITAAQILHLLERLQAEFSLAYLLITHDLRMVRAAASEVLVLQEGKIIERKETELLFTQPEAAYTRELIDASF